MVKSQNSGVVFIMRFKLCVFFILLISNGSAIALTLDSVSKEYIAKKTIALGKKVNECKGLRKEYQFKIITDEWFNSLSIQDKKQVVSFAFQYASTKCSEKEFNELSGSLVKYVAEGGDPKALEAWVAINKMSSRSIKQINELGIEQVLNVIDENFNAPFDPMMAVTHYNLTN